MVPGGVAHQHLGRGGGGGIEMQWIHVFASAGVLLAYAAVGVFITAACFGDLLHASDESLEKAMHAALYLALAALAVVAFVAAVVVYRVCPLTPSAGI